VEALDRKAVDAPAAEQYRLRRLAFVEARHRGRAAMDDVQVPAPECEEPRAG
jgi:hypothetical protein